MPDKHVIYHSQYEANADQFWSNFMSDPKVWDFLLNTLTAYSILAVVFFICGAVKEYRGGNSKTLGNVLETAFLSGFLWPIYVYHGFKGVLNFKVKGK